MISEKDQHLPREDRQMEPTLKNDFYFDTTYDGKLNLDDKKTVSQPSLKIYPMFGLMPYTEYRARRGPNLQQTLLALMETLTHVQPKREDHH